MAITTWHTADSLRAVWSNAPSSADLIADLLEAAKFQILEFAPALPDTEESGAAEAIPANYRIAQGLQARAIWESQKADVSGDPDAIGLGEYPVRVYSMAKPVRDLLRPAHGAPVIG